MLPHMFEPSHPMFGQAASRRTLMKGMLGLGAAALAPSALLARGTSAQEASPVRVPEPFAGETFIGLADDGETHVAVVIAPGAAGTDREIRFYGCNGQDRNLWLTGVSTGDSLDLTAEGAQLQAALAPTGVTGEMTLPDGASVTFEADRAEGIAGLYEVVVSDGRLEGLGGAGQRLQGAVAGKLLDGSLVLAAVVALPYDTVQALAGIATADLAGELRWIVRDGSLAGGPRVVQGVTRGSGFMGSDIEFAVPEAAHSSSTRWMIFSELLVDAMRRTGPG